MAKQAFNDLGLGSKARRLINKEGTFNVRRTGQPLSAVNLYQNLIRMPWSFFHLLTFGALILVNGLFALVYLAIGPEHLDGIATDAPPLSQYLHCLYFSFQTFTTVGYGHISPKGDLISFVAAVEAMTGLMIFAVITGLLYGRFAKPTAKIIYSKNMLVSPYRDGISYQFRIVNKRKSIIMDLHARMMVSFVENGKARRYQPLELERASVVLFPLNWTIVHPVNPSSPLYGLTQQDLKDKDAEFIIVLKGYDDTFSQEVNSIYSYGTDDVIWGAKFDMMYDASTNGNTVLQVDRLDSYTQPDPYTENDVRDKATLNKKGEVR